MEFSSFDKEKKIFDSWRDFLLNENGEDLKLKITDSDDTAMHAEKDWAVEENVDLDFQQPDTGFTNKGDTGETPAPVPGTEPEPEPEPEPEAEPAEPALAGPAEESIQRTQHRNQRLLKENIRGAVTDALAKVYPDAKPKRTWGEGAADEEDIVAKMRGNIARDWNQQGTGPGASMEQAERETLISRLSGLPDDPALGLAGTGGRYAKPGVGCTTGEVQIGSMSDGRPICGPPSADGPPPAPTHTDDDDEHWYGEEPSWVPPGATTTPFERPGTAFTDFTDKVSQNLGIPRGRMPRDNEGAAGALRRLDFLNLGPRIRGEMPWHGTKRYEESLNNPYLKQMIYEEVEKLLNEQTPK